MTLLKPSVQIEVVASAVVVLDLLPNLAIFDPGDMVFHVAVNVEGRISHCLHANLNVSLLDVHHSLLDCLRHFKSLHDDWQSSSAKGRDIDLLALSQTLPLGNQAHLVEFFNELLCFGNTVGVALLQGHQLGNYLLDLPNDFVVLLVVVPVLDVVPSEHVQLPHV